MDPTAVSPVYLAGLIDSGATALANGDFNKAIARFKQAVALDPNHAEAHALLGWTKYELTGRSFDGASLCIKAINRAFRADPNNPAAFLFLGLITLTYSDDVASGIDYIERAAEWAPMQVTSEALDHLAFHLSDTDPGRLERLYRRMLTRAEKESVIAREIWQRLAHLYRTLQDHFNAELALRMAGETDDTPELCSELVAWLAEPSSVALCNQAWATVLDRGDPDLTYRLAATIAAIGPAQCQGPHTKLPPRAPVRGNRALTPSMWNAIRDPDDLLVLDAIAEIVGPQVHRVAPYSLDSLGVDEYMLLPPEDWPESLSDCVDYTSFMLSVDQPPVYVDPRLGYQMCVGAMREPVLLIGDDILRYPNPTSLVHWLGHSMSYLSPGRLLAAAWPEQFLHRLLTRGQDDLLNAMTPEIAEKLRALLDRVATQTGDIDVAQWRAGLARTADRLGMVLAGDLKTVLRDGYDRYRHHGVVRFWLSHTHGKIRRELGCAHQVGLA